MMSVVECQLHGGSDSFATRESISVSDSDSSGQSSDPSQTTHQGPVILPNPWRDWVIDGLIKYRVWWLLLACLLTAISIWPANQLKFDESIESMYAPGNPYLKDYLESKEWFGGDEFIFIAYHDPELFEEAGENRLSQLADEVSAVPGVIPTSVQCLATYLRMTRHPAFRSRREELLDFSRGVLLGSDNQTTCIAVRLQESERAVDSNGQPISRGQTIAKLRALAEKQSFPTFVIGEPILVHDMFRYAQEDGEFMGWAASALLIGVVLFFLRDLRSVILPFVIVQMTILWTKAGLWASHLELTMVSSVLGSLLTIIGVSTVVYMSLYYHELRQSLDRETAFRRMLQVIGIDIIFVCLTTAAGFAAQLSSHLHPVQSFGITMVLGSLLVLVAMTLVLPGGMLLGPDRAGAQKPRGDQQVSQWLASLTQFVLVHRFWMGIVTLAAVIYGTAGLMQLQVETDFTKNFRSSSPVVKSLDFLETRLGGAGLWEVNFPAPHRLTDEHLDKVRHLAENLRGLIGTAEGQGLTKVVAMTDGLDLVPLLPFLIPDAQAQSRWLNSLQPEFVPSLYNAEQGRMRIMLRGLERQSAREKQALIDRVETLAKEQFPDAKVTGLFVLLNYLIDSLLQDQRTDLMVGALGLIAIMSIAYRSIVMGFVSLVPNVLPIMLLLGTMGWLGLRVNIGTAMISSDTMGLTIHDSIFYMSAYLRARRSGLNFQGALGEVQTEVRKPLIYSNVALILGFLVLTTSHFVPLITFGVLVSTAIAGGLLVNLLLLPPLLQLVDRPWLGLTPDSANNARTEETARAEQSPVEPTPSV